MMELRIGLMAVICCAFVTAAGCGGSDEGTGKDADDGDETPTAGSDNTPVAGSSSAGTSAGGRSGSAGSSSNGNSGGGSTGGTSTVATGGSLATGGTGTPGTAQCAEGEPPLCVDDTTIRVCFEGAYEQATCQEVCSDVFHLATGPCDTTENACACGDPENVECFDGISALCTCLPPELGQCTEEDFFAIYAACAEDHPEASRYGLCYQQFVMQDEAGEYFVDCSMAVTECGLPGEDMPAMPAPAP